MQDASTLQSKAERAQGRASWAEGIAYGGAFYGMFSCLPNQPASNPRTPYDMTLGWAIDLIDTANHLGSFFFENVLSIKIPAAVLGAAAGFGTSLAAGLYSHSQQRKMAKFQAQADEISGKNKAFPSASNGLKL